MDDHVGGNFTAWLLGALAALAGFIWRRQERRMEQVEAIVKDCNNHAAQLVVGHEATDFAAHARMTETMTTEITELRREIGETRREVKGDLNTVIGLLQNGRNGA